MLNPELYEALAKAFGVVGISNEDDPGNFRQTRPYKETLVVTSAVKKKNYAEVLRPWGECYKVNCPMCGDTKQRLFINYLCGAKLKIGSRWVYFSNRMFYCHNEHCNASPYLKKEVDVEWGTLTPQASPVKQATRGKQLINVKMPSPFYPIISEEVPDSVFEYLMVRKFDPQMLWRKYQVYYAPPGAVWDTREKDGEEYNLTFRYPRIVVPIFKGYRMVSWQARIAQEDFPSKVPKYLNAPDGLPKSELLYNMDGAKWHTQVGIVEGVTDVWRGGDAFVCTFGKDLHEGQQKILKDLWGHYGWCILFPDGDDPKALAKAKTSSKVINQKRLVYYGSDWVEIPKGRDPAQCTNKQLTTWLSGAVTDMVKRARIKRGLKKC